MATNKQLLGSYAAANEFLGNKDSRTWPNIRSTRIYRNTHDYVSDQNGNYPICVEYHNTDVVVYYADGRIRLNSGGYETHATKQRINDFCANSEAKIRVFQRDFMWYVRTKAGEFPFKDYMIILPDGNVDGQPRTIYNENFGFVRLEIKEYAPNSRKLYVHLTADGKHWYRENKSRYKDKIDTDVLYDLLEPVICNSEWAWLNVVDLGWLTDDRLPVLSMNYQDDPNTAELIGVQWAYAVNNHSWVISGLENDFKTGVIEFDGVHCQMLHKDVATNIEAFFTALAEYAALNSK